MFDVCSGQTTRETDRRDFPWIYLFPFLGRKGISKFRIIFFGVEKGTPFFRLCFRELVVGLRRFPLNPSQFFILFLLPGTPHLPTPRRYSHTTIYPTTQHADSRKKNSRATQNTTMDTQKKGRSFLGIAFRLVQHFLEYFPHLVLEGNGGSCDSENRILIIRQSRIRPCWEGYCPGKKFFWGWREGNGCINNSPLPLIPQRLRR